MSNSSSIRHFLLLALADMRQLQLLHFCLLLGISLAALLGNGLIITAVACGHHLHTPMFFLLLNLALADLGCICTTVPKAMHNSLWDTRDISYTGCAAQLFFFVFFIGTEFSLLTVMCYDRYVSICKPLHYRTLLGSRACAHMAAAAWASGFLTALMHTASTFSLPLCHGNALGQFFCEIPQILKLSCFNLYLRELGFLVFSISLGLGCSVLIVFSYVQIFKAVLRIPSEQGWHKAFSTCLPHLAVVSLFLSTIIFSYLKPPSMSSPSLNLVLSVSYSVVPPALNPLIYSLRNQELKAAVWRLMTACFQGQRILVLKEFSADGLHPERSLGLPLGGIQCANPHSAAKMIGQVCASVCTVFSLVYSGYYLTQLTQYLPCNLQRLPSLPERVHGSGGSTAGSAAPLPGSVIEEEAEEEQRNIKPPAAVPPQPECAEPLNTGSAIQPGATGAAWPAAASSPPLLVALSPAWPRRQQRCILVHSRIQEPASSTGTSLVALEENPGAFPCGCGTEERAQLERCFRWSL
ncbi:olfactory receptor 14J1-like [Melozone crissalis]|uniref:olfactory receptor 14J1-like n=1 Tax=Melozone crissalis TaxID=40204 RepID=UPI0023DBE332|nr:olfactory receptor 14J1-like [Melozone crissalis]